MRTTALLLACLCGAAGVASAEQFGRLTGRANGSFGQLFADILVANNRAAAGLSDGRRFYIQCLQVHAAPPVHTTAGANDSGDLTPDNLDARPGDQDVTCETSLSIRASLQTSPLPFTWRVDVFEGPDSEGWQLRAEMVFDGDRWVRIQEHKVGPGPGLGGDTRGQWVNIGPEP